MDLAAILDVPELRGTRWSVEVLDGGGATLAARDPHLLLPTASLGKVFLLVEVAARLEAATLDPTSRLDRRAVEPVADSGLWRHLATETLAVADLAVLVGAVSDNLATNVLLRAVGLDAVRRRAAALAPGGSLMLDAVRDERGPEHEAAPSVGCARDHAGLFHALRRGGAVSAQVSDQVLGWLQAGCDLSMVAGAFDLDPLAHPADATTRLAHKTGTDDAGTRARVRADAGTVRWRGREASYAVICVWDPVESSAREVAEDGRLGAVLRAMRQVGRALRRTLESG